MKKILVFLLSVIVLWPLDAMAMNQSAVPTKFNIPWGNGAGVPYIRNIPQASQIGIQNCAASLTDGFPPLTFTPSNAGGCPPFGADFNGILRQMSQWEQWQAAGGPILYDAGFQSAVGGYPKQATLANASTPGCFWISSIDANGTDPDTGGANWIKSCQSPWTISGNNIYNNNTANVGVNTTSPATLFDIEGTNAVYKNGSNGNLSPNLFQVAAGSDINPIISKLPTVAISRQEALPGGQDTEGGQNAALFVQSLGSNTSSGGNIAQVNALTAYAVQDGTGDVVGVFGSATQASASFHSYAGFFTAAATNSGGSSIAVGTATAPPTAASYTLSHYQGTQVGSFGIDLAGVGASGLNTAAVLIRSAPVNWDVGVYWQSAANTYYLFSSAFNVDTAGHFNTTSDRTMKESISAIPDGALDKVMSLVPSTYAMVSDPHKRIYAGLMAQDVQPVMPEAVSRNPNDNHLMTNDSSIMAYLIKAVQELKQKNDALTAQVKELSK